MANLIYATNVSLDGSIEDEVFTFHTDRLRSEVAVLYGRRPVPVVRMIELITRSSGGDKRLAPAVATLIGS